MKNSMGFFCFLFIFLSAASLSLQQLQNNDMVGLIAFKSSSIQEDPKGYLANWSSKSSSICLWNGVICSPGNQVTSLNFINANLTGELCIHDIIALRDLKHICFRGSSFSGDLKMSLTYLQTYLFQGEFILSVNFLETGNFLSGLCSSSSSLQKILFRSYYLSGTLPSELGNRKNLRTIDLSFNNFSSSIPLGIWALPNLSDLVMWANSLTGELPESICSDGEGNLEKLILSNNFLTGTIPQSLTKCTNLRWVSLASNRLSGKIPPGISNLSNLAVLQLGNNSFTGEIPSELGKCMSLIWIELNNNGFNRYIPPEQADQSGLITSSFFDDDIEVAFVTTVEDSNCKRLQGLVMLEGIRTQRLNDFLLMHSCSSLRIYPSVSSYSFLNGGSLLYLDFSYNFLTGHIPNSIGSITYLQALDLEHNKLTGTIQSRLGDLRNIKVLDISDNDLEGLIPSSFGTLSSLSVLDVSNNNLTGSIPSAGHLITLHRRRLCGTPLPPCMSAAKRPPPYLNLPEKKKKHSIYMDEGFWSVLQLKTSWRYSTFSFMDKLTKKFCLF